jgi:hypothetical protein
MRFMDNILQTINAKTFELEERIRVMNAEIEVIKAELVRLEAAKSVILELSPGAVSNQPLVATWKDITATLSQNTKRARILTIANELIQSGTKTTEEILDALNAKDVQVAGDDRKTQLRNLSAYLSRAKDELNIESTRLGWSRVISATDRNDASDLV